MAQQFRELSINGNLTRSECLLGNVFPPNRRHFTTVGAIESLIRANRRLFAASMKFPPCATSNWAKLQKRRSAWDVDRFKNDECVRRPGHNESQISPDQFVISRLAHLRSQSSCRAFDCRWLCSQSWSFSAAGSARLRCRAKEASRSRSQVSLVSARLLWLDHLYRGIPTIGSYPFHLSPRNVQLVWNGLEISADKLYIEKNFHVKHYVCMCR